MVCNWRYLYFTSFTKSHEARIENASSLQLTRREVRSRLIDCALVAMGLEPPAATRLQENPKTEDRFKAESGKERGTQVIGVYSVLRKRCADTGRNVLTEPDS